MITGAVILIMLQDVFIGNLNPVIREVNRIVVGTFSINRDENLTVVANRENIEDREAFARELLQMYKNDFSFDKILHRQGICDEP